MRIIENLISKIENDDYEGWDVFDGLSSKLLQKTPFYKSRFCRLAWIQLFKRMPLNFRAIAMIPKGYNAKGLALFIQGYLNLYKINKEKINLDKAYKLAEIIISQRAKGRDYFCVGYNFHWEAKAFSVPAYKPNMIVSSFIAQAFLDLYEIDKNEKWLLYATDIGLFIEKELKLFEDDKEICFGYIPGEKARVHNANLMGAKLFARLFSIHKEEKYSVFSKKSVNYSVNAQREDGAWVYGERDHHKWVDNFHTGFNLLAINSVQKYLQIQKWNNSIEIGLKYHLKNHFLEDMTPKYFDTSLYPIDIHNFAQGIDTLLTFGYKDKADLLYKKAIEIMWDDKKNYFYYQKTKKYTNKINYIRWAQAWMFYALTKLEMYKKNRIIG